MARRGPASMQTLQLAMIAAALRLACLAFATGATTPLAQKQGTVPVTGQPKVTKTSSGGTFGYIPIGYSVGTLNRTGSYYLPKGYDTQAMPVLLMLHGSRVNGSYIVGIYKNLADRYKFIIVAPDSDQPLDWNIPKNASEPFTNDWYHILACYEYVRSRPKVRFDYTRIALGGNSRGGYGAVALATRTSFATHSLCTHSRFLAPQCGSHVLPIYLTTGQSDTQFPPSTEAVYLAQIRKARPDLPITYRVFAGAHGPGSADELFAFMAWWYGTKGATSTQSAL